jgi:hypothetical protein
MVVELNPEGSIPLLQQPSSQNRLHRLSLGEIRQIEWILGLCASYSTQPSIQRDLEDACRVFTHWNSLVTLAEYHGLGPLLHTRLAAAAVSVPADTSRALKGLYIRHRHANSVRSRVLAEILRAYAAAGIDTLVLKGAALAFLVYSSPGLRPMRDLDLLVREADARRAQQILLELGFDTSPDRSHILTPEHPHLEVARRWDEGMKISVEVHFRLYPRSIHYPPHGFEDLVREAVSFRVDSVKANTLGVEDMLGHVVRHACGPPLLGTPLRFIHLCDVIGLVDKFANTMDWPKLIRRYPHAGRILPLLNVSTDLRQQGVGRIPCAGDNIWRTMFQDYQGWPRMPVADLGNNKTWVKETFFPGEWWVRLFYGTGGHGSWLWHRWVRHPLHVLEWFVDSMRKKV